MGKALIIRYLAFDIRLSFVPGHESFSNGTGLP